MSLSETPHTLAEKKFRDLTSLTPGMHGYSMLRTGLNSEYFHSIFDQVSWPCVPDEWLTPGFCQCLKFGINIESHHTETGN